MHSCCHATADEALTDWQAGVGLPAAEGTDLAPVDDPWLLAELMPYEQGMVRPGGENAEQFAEYHRSKRPAEAVLDVTGPTTQPRTPAPAGLDHTTDAKWADHGSSYPAKTWGWEPRSVHTGTG